MSRFLNLDNAQIALTSKCAIAPDFWGRERCFSGDPSVNLIKISFTFLSAFCNKFQNIALGQHLGAISAKTSMGPPGGISPACTSSFVLVLAKVTIKAFACHREREGLRQTYAQQRIDFTVSAGTLRDLLPTWKKCTCAEESSLTQDKW